MNEYIKQLIKLPSMVKFFLITELIMGLGMGIWQLNLNFFLSSRGMGLAEIGRMVSVSTFSTALFAVFCGTICDRIGYKCSMVIGGVLKAGAMLATLIVIPDSVFLLVRVMNGLGDCLILVCIYPYIISFVEGELKNTVYSLFFSIMMFSLFSGYVIAGVLAVSVQSYNTLLLISVIVVAIAVILRFFLPDIHEKKVQGFKLYLPKKKFIIWYLIYALIGYCNYYLAYSMLNLICRDIIRLPDEFTGYIMGIMTLASAIGVFIVPVIVNKFSRVNANTTVMILLCCLYAGMAFISGGNYLLLVVLTATLQCMRVGFIDGPILSNVADNEKGSFSGFRLLFINLGISLGIFMAGWLMDHTPGVAILYLAVSMLTAVELLIFIFGFKKNVMKAG